ncbi:MAG: flagellar biosynthesis anti-sigma factor FlgM [Phycisphaerae bacterium]
MNISPLGSGGPVTRLQGRTAISSSSAGSQDVSRAGQDTVEISDVARYLGEVKKLPDIRQEKVDLAKQAIASGTLDTPEKLDAAVGRMIDEQG